MGDRQLAWHFSCAMQCRDGDGDVSCCMMFPLAVTFLLPFAQQTLLQAGRASSPRQLPNVDGNSCEGLDWLPCHGLILERSRGSDRAWTTAKVGDGL